MKRAGFTLFELIVAISILMLVFGLAISGYTTFNKRERLRQAGLTIKSNLRFAQSKAFSVDKPTSGCSVFLGMQVTFTATTYSIHHLCAEGVVGSSETIALPPSIVFSPIPASFLFHPLKGTISIVSGQSIVLSNSLSTYTLSITGTGDVSDGGIQ